jgi:hypothetical protein
MKKRLWTYLSKSSRLVVFTLVALSMAAAIAFPSVTVRVPLQARIEPPASSEQKQLLPGVPDSDESAGKMGTGRRQQAAPILVAVPPVPMKSDDGLKRQAEFGSDETVFPDPVQFFLSNSHPISLPHVSSRVARRATLVGARPSGTM